jgi:hypothetical protein
MKAYLVTTGTLFILLTIVHVVRAVGETNLARDPWYILVTVIALALALWALRLLQKAPRSS